MRHIQVKDSIQFKVRRGAFFVYNFFFFVVVFFKYSFSLIHLLTCVFFVCFIRSVSACLKTPECRFSESVTFFPHSKYKFFCYRGHQRQKSDGGTHVIVRFLFEILGNPFPLFEEKIEKIRDVYLIINNC